MTYVQAKAALAAATLKTNGQLKRLEELAETLGQVPLFGSVLALLFCIPCSKLILFVHRHRLRAIVARYTPALDARSEPG